MPLNLWWDTKKMHRYGLVFRSNWKWIYSSSVKWTLKKQEKEQLWWELKMWHSGRQDTAAILALCWSWALNCCSWLDSWISRRFGKCHVSFFLNKHKRCLYFSLKGYIWWAKIPFKHWAVAISQLLFPPNFHMSFENKVLYFFKNSRNFAMEKCHLDNHIFMPRT